MIYRLDNREVKLIGGPHFIANNATLVGSVVVRARANIWFNVVIRADNDVIDIGENSNIQDGSVLHTDSGIPLTIRSEEHTSELQSRPHLVCRLLLEKKKKKK